MQSLERHQPPAGLESPRILVLSRSESFSARFRPALTSAGYRMRDTCYTRDALAMADDSSLDLLFIDLRAADMNGADLILRFREVASDLPVVVACGEDAELAGRVIEAGASDFVANPCEPDALVRILTRNLLRPAESCIPTPSSIDRDANPLETVLDTILSALNTRDTEEPGHVERVTACTMLIAEAMGVSWRERYHIERGALLHDIGKIAIPDRILMKRGPLTEAERSELSRHPEIGFGMCGRIDFLRGAAQIVLHHHERWDGAGYPDGLVGPLIPLGARIFAVANAFDALTAPADGGAPVEAVTAGAQIERDSGRAFDPAVVAALLSLPTPQIPHIYG